jgi:hypothetical protein
MNSKYNPAYVECVVYGGGDVGNNTMAVPFLLNVNSASGAALRAVWNTANALQSDGNRRNDFWVAYVLMAYQPKAPYDPTVATDRADEDPDSESALPGVADAIGGRGAAVFLEAWFIDQGPVLTIVQDEQLIVVHEIGHEFGLPDRFDPATGVYEPNLMGALYNMGYVFKDQDLHNIRSQPESPGRRPVLP